jgi:hypothetical protein
MPRALSVARKLRFFLTFSFLALILPLFSRNSSHVVQNVQGFPALQDVITTPAVAPPAKRNEWATILIAIAWNVWLARKRMIFDNSIMPSRRLEINCWDTITLRANRCKKEPREAIMNWAAANVGS